MKKTAGSQWIEIGKLALQAIALIVAIAAIIISLDANRTAKNSSNPIVYIRGVDLRGPVTSICRSESGDYWLVRDWSDTFVFENSGGLSVSLVGAEFLDLDGKGCTVRIFQKSQESGALNELHPPVDLEAGTGRFYIVTARCEVALGATPETAVAKAEEIMAQTPEPTEWKFHLSNRRWVGYWRTPAEYPLSSDLTYQMDTPCSPAEVGTATP